MRLISPMLQPSAAINLHVDSRAPRFAQVAVASRRSASVMDATSPHRTLAEGASVGCGAVNGRRLLLVIVASVTTWYAVTFAAWALPAQTDSVPLGVDYSLTPAKAVTDDVECSVFDSAARDADTGPPPTFMPQPGDAPELAYQREPCTDVHRQARALFVANTAVLAVVWILGGVLWARLGRTRDDWVVPAVLPS
jgi:hypothetical protein